jgi:hypothetical protein
MGKRRQSHCETMMDGPFNICLVFWEIKGGRREMKKGHLDIMPIPIE